MKISKSLLYFIGGILLGAVAIWFFWRLNSSDNLLDLIGGILSALTSVMGLIKGWKDLFISNKKNVDKEKPISVESSHLSNIMINPTGSSQYLQVGNPRRKRKIRPDDRGDKTKKIKKKIGSARKGKN